jgi:isoamylase
MLRHSLYLHEGGDPKLDIHELTWLLPSGDAAERGTFETSPDCFGMLLHGSARPSGLPQRGHMETLLLIANDYHAATDFTLPSANGGGNWLCVVDTLSADAPPATVHAPGEIYTLQPQTLVLLVLQAASETHQSSWQL